jgi:hypothetical protein
MGWAGSAGPDRAARSSMQPITWSESIRRQLGYAACRGSDQGLPMPRALAPNHP